jgi:hypothetical protein
LVWVFSSVYLDMISSFDDDGPGSQARYSRRYSAAVSPDWCVTSAVECVWSVKIQAGKRHDSGRFGIWKRRGDQTVCIRCGRKDKYLATCPPRGRNAHREVLAELGALLALLVAHLEQHRRWGETGGCDVPLPRRIGAWAHQAAPLGATHGQESSAKSNWMPEPVGIRGTRRGSPTASML